MLLHSAFGPDDWRFMSDVRQTGRVRTGSAAATAADVDERLDFLIRDFEKNLGEERGLIRSYVIETPTGRERVIEYPEATVSPDRGSERRRATSAGEQDEGPVVPMADDLTDAKVAAAEARTDAKLAGFQGQFNVLSLKLDGIAGSVAKQREEASANRTAVITTVFGVGVALAALLWAAITYGDSVFGRGMAVRDVVDAAVHDVMSKQLSKGQ